MNDYQRIQAAEKLCELRGQDTDQSKPPFQTALAEIIASDDLHEALSYGRAVAAIANPNT